MWFGGFLFGWFFVVCFSKQLSLLNRKTYKVPEVQGTFSQLVLLVKTIYCAVLIVVHLPIAEELSHRLCEELNTMVVLC